MPVCETNLKNGFEERFCKTNLQNNKKKIDFKF